MLRNGYEGKATCSHANTSGYNFPKSYPVIYSRRSLQSKCIFSASDAFVIVMTTLTCVSYVINPAIDNSIDSTLLAISARGIAHSFQIKVPLISLLSLLYEFLSVPPCETPQGFEVQLSEEMFPGKRATI